MKKYLFLTALIIMLILSSSSAAFATSEEQEEFTVIDTGIDPLLVIDKIEIDDEIAVGKEFYVRFVVKNMGTGAAMFPKFYFKEPDENDILKHFEVTNSADGSTDCFDPGIREFNSKEIRSFSVKMKVKDSTAERANGYKVNVNLKSQNSLMSSNKYFETGTNITIIPKYTLTKPLFVIKAVEFDPREPDFSQPFKTTIFFENISETDAHNVSIALEGNINSEIKNFTILDLSNTKHIFDVKGKQTRMVSFDIEAEEPREGNEIKIKFTYYYEGKEETQEEIINLPLPRENIGASGKVPWVIINKYTLSNEQILAGNTVILKLFVENTNIKDVYNAKVSIVDIQLEDNQKGDTVFSPVDSSNTFYIESIPGKTAVTKEIALFVDPNAQAKTYNVPIEIKYEYDNGQQITVNERVNIPVTQECKFTVLSLDVPQKAFVGQPVPVAAEFVNVGKVSLVNFMVNMEGDFNKENAVYYVGNLETGMSDYYQAMLFPEKEGELEGKVVFTFLNNNNQEERLEKPFKINIENQPASPSGIEGGPNGKELGREGNIDMIKQGLNGGSSSSGILGKIKGNILTIVLLTIVGAQGIIMWRLKRKTKQNEDFLDV